MMNRQSMRRLTACRKSMEAGRRCRAENIRDMLFLRSDFDGAGDQVGMLLEMAQREGV